MGLTLNQVRGRLIKLAVSHRQINTVLFVDYDEPLDGNELQYPACVIAMQTDNKISLRDRYTYFNFKIYFFDLINLAVASQENEYEVKSDLVSIAEDYVAMLNYFGYQDDWTINDEYPLTVASYQLQELCGGVCVDVRIGILYDANRCQVPAVGITFENDNSMKIITNYIFCVTAESTEVTLPAMIGKEIILFYLGDKLLSPFTDKTAVPPNQYRFSVDTGRFEFGVLIEPAQDGQPAQTIQILNRSL